MPINKNIFKALRLRQWIKNLLIFSALIFSGKLMDVHFLLKTIVAFFLFSFTVSGVYLLNDCFDLKHDLNHPIKKNRPLAQGLLTVSESVFSALILFLFSIGIAFFVDINFMFVLILYIFLNILYTVYVKHILIVDVLFLSLFFILRVLAGALVISVSASFWLIICTFMLATFIGFGKRRHELMELDKIAKEHRKVLQYYEPYFLDQMMAVVATSTVITFILYTVSDAAVSNFGSVKLLYTTPLVLYGVFRYLYLIHCKKKGGDPATLIVNDTPMVINVILWALLAVILIYL